MKASWLRGHAIARHAQKKTLVAREQDRADIRRHRTRWRTYQRRIDPARLVFIDETWAKTNITRLYGWAPNGERLIDKVPHSHWETATFLAALRSGGSSVAAGAAAEPIGMAPLCEAAVLPSLPARPRNPSGWRRVAGWSRCFGVAAARVPVFSVPLALGLCAVTATIAARAYLRGPFNSSWIEIVLMLHPVLPMRAVLVAAAAAALKLLALANLSVSAPSSASVAQAQLRAATAARVADNPLTLARADGLTR